MVYIACSFYLIQSYFNCIVVLFFLFLTTVTLCGLLQLHYFQNLWSEYMPDLLVTYICVMILVLLKLLWQNAVTFIQLLKYINFYITLYLLTFGIHSCFLRTLLDLLEGTVIVYLFLEYGPLVDKRVCL